MCVRFLLFIPDLLLPLPGRSYLSAECTGDTPWAEKAAGKRELPQRRWDAPYLC